MIGIITGGSPSVYVSSNSAEPYISPGAYSAGMVRYCANRLEVYDGITWLQLSSGASVSLSPAAEEAIAWARQQKQEQERLEQLIQQHPGLKDAYEKFEIMKILVTQEHKDSK